MGNLRNVYRYTGGGKTISGGGMADGFIFNRPDGADSFPANAERIDRISGIGSKPVFLKLSPRPITQEGWILRDKIAMGQLLQQVFTPLETVELEAELPDKSKWWLDCQVTQTPDIQESWSKPRWQAVMVANYPLWRSKTLNSLDLPVGDNTVNIGGQGPTAFTVNVNGAGSAFTLTEKASGKRLSFSGGGSGNLKIRVDIDGKITATAGGADVIGKVSGDLLAMPAGTVTLNFSRAANLVWREVRLGV